MLGNILKFCDTKTLSSMELYVYSMTILSISYNDVILEYNGYSLSAAVLLMTSCKYCISIKSQLQSKVFSLGVFCLYHEVMARYQAYIQKYKHTTLQHIAQSIHILYCLPRYLLNRASILFLSTFTLGSTKYLTGSVK